MTKADKALVILLRFLGVTMLFALVAVFMPVSWMDATHRWLGLGKIPIAPVVEYLARSLSAFYAVFGALHLLAASDLERYRPLVRFLGMTSALMGVVLLGIDLAAGMPWWWSAFEGPPTVALGVLMFFLARTIRLTTPINCPQESGRQDGIELMNREETQHETQTNRRRKASAARAKEEVHDHLYQRQAKTGSASSVD